MKVIALNYADAQGGAARAAFRILQAVRSQGINAELWAGHATSGDPSVVGPASSVPNRIRELLGDPFIKLLGPSDDMISSPAIVPSRWHARLDRAAVDVVHLHWINGEMMSVRDIGRIRQPIVWTLHDMWPFCGGEHYTTSSRWRDGYTPARPGFDFDRWVWQRKSRHWREPMHIVAPSRWLADCVSQSRLMRDWPVCVIPNAIDTTRWHPVEQEVARDILYLPRDEPVILYGAHGGTQDPRKGFDLLREALNAMQHPEHFRVAIMGEPENHTALPRNIKATWLGTLRDDTSLRLAYSAADAVVIPSRQDNLPNGGVESLACGTPVVAFDTGGLADIVEHKINGYLAAAFDTDDMAQGLDWIVQSMSNAGTAQQLRQAARRHAEAHFAYDTVGHQYATVYRELCHTA